MPSSDGTTRLAFRVNYGVCVEFAEKGARYVVDFRDFRVVFRSSQYLFFVYPKGLYSRIGTLSYSHHGCLCSDGYRGQHCELFKGATASNNHDGPNHSMHNASGGSMSSGM